MLRSHLRALRSIQADLQSRAGTEELEHAAWRLFAFYEREAQLADALIDAKPPPKTRPAYRRGKPAKRHKPRKPTSADFILAILRESAEPMEAGAIRERLTEEHRAIGRQGMSYTLKKLERRGLIERMPATEGRARFLWRAAD